DPVGPTRMPPATIADPVCTADREIGPRLGLPRRSDEPTKHSDDVEFTLSRGRVGREEHACGAVCGRQDFAGEAPRDRRRSIEVEALDLHAGSDRTGALN